MTKGQYPWWVDELPNALLCKTSSFDPSSSSLLWPAYHSINSKHGVSDSICFNSVHKGRLFKKSEMQIHKIDESKPAIKILRTILRAFNLNPNHSHLYQLPKCNCETLVNQEMVNLIDPSILVRDLSWKGGDTFFFRRRAVAQIGLEERIGEKAVEQVEE